MPLDHDLANTEWSEVTIEPLDSSGPIETQTLTDWAWTDDDLYFWLIDGSDNGAISWH